MKNASLAELAFHPDPTSVSLHDPLGDRQSEADPPVGDPLSEGGAHCSADHHSERRIAHVDGHQSDRLAPLQAPPAHREQK
jgi:hypothetical protein